MITNICNLWKYKTYFVHMYRIYLYLQYLNLDFIPNIYISEKSLSFMNKYDLEIIWIGNIINAVKVSAINI